MHAEWLAYLNHAVTVFHVYWDDYWYLKGFALMFVGVQVVEGIRLYRRPAKVISEDRLAKLLGTALCMAFLWPYVVLFCSAALVIMTPFYLLSAALRLGGKRVVARPESEAERQEMIDIASNLGAW